MIKSKHTLQSALLSLSKKRDCKIVQSNNARPQIKINVSEKRKNDLGNSSHGKIDFLVKEYNFQILKTLKF